MIDMTACLCFSKIDIAIVAAHKMWSWAYEVR